MGRYKSRATFLYDTNSISDVDQYLSPLTLDWCIGELKYIEYPKDHPNTSRDPSHYTDADLYLVLRYVLK